MERHREEEDRKEREGLEEKGDEPAKEPRHLRRSFQDLHKAIRERKKLQVPHPVPVAGPFTLGTGAVKAVAEKKKKPDLVIKQIVRQEVGATKARKKRVAKGNKTELKAKKSEYATLKKSLRKRLVQRKKDAYKAEAARIKALPAKERPAARKALKAKLKADHAAKLKLIPTLGRRKYNEIVALINKLRKLKW